MSLGNSEIFNAGIQCPIGAQKRGDLRGMYQLWNAPEYSRNGACGSFYYFETDTRFLGLEESSLKYCKMTQIWLVLLRRLETLVKVDIDCAKDKC